MARIHASIVPGVVAAAMLAAAAPAFATPGHEVPAKVEAALGGEVTETASGLYRVDPARGPDFTTHGPDPRPDKETADHGGGIGSGDPERAPVCADDPATDYYQEAIYAYPSSAQNQLATDQATIRTAVRRMNAVLNEESLASGGPTADYVFRCDADGSIRVSAVAVPVSGSASFSQVRSAVRSAGHANRRVDYTIFYDGAGPSGICGTATLWSDEALRVSNRNNNPGGSIDAGYAVTYPGCWLGSTPMHENGHNQGAVQYGAPYSTGDGGHCYDENDVMCYSPDGGNLNQSGTISRCTNRLHFDCGWDTYFDSAPEPGEWLATHWNVGSHLNRFIAFGAAAQNTSPSADFDAECLGVDCSFTDLSTDSDGAIVARSWDFGDGAGSTETNPSHSYSSSGTYEVALTVTDGDGASTTLRREVAAYRPPPNDPLAAAEPLDGADDAATGTTLGATKQPGEPNHVDAEGGDGGASAWYRWAAPADGHVAIDTCGSDFDTLLAVYEGGGDFAGQTRIASNDDSAGPRCESSRQSEVAFSARAGDSYWIVVDGWDPVWTSADDPERGQVALSLQLDTPPSPASAEPAPTADPQTGPGTGPQTDPGIGPGATGEPEGSAIAYPVKLLRTGTPLVDAAGPRGSVHRYRVAVPRRVKTMLVSLDGPDCERDGACPDLGLGLADSRDPAAAETSCLPATRGADERCRVRRPHRGSWWVTVENSSAEPETEFSLRLRIARSARKRR